MCSLNPPIFRPNLGWPLLDTAIGYEQKQQHRFFPEAEGNSTTDSFFHLPPTPQQEARLNRCASSTETNNHSGDQSIDKKLSHNASERDRRKKLNALYSSLRSLLPASDHTKKLSIPGTVSRVLKYIPEMQQEVQRLSQKKEGILKRITSRPSHSGHREKETGIRGSLLPGILATRLSETEISIQISTIHKTVLSDVLLSLEETGLRLLSASSFSSSSKRVFYSIHLEMERGCQMNSEELTDKLLLLYDKKE